MKRLFAFLLSGCFHEWEIIANHDVFYSNIDSKYPYGKKYTLRCKKCGNMKVFKDHITPVIWE